MEQISLKDLIYNQIPNSVATQLAEDAQSAENYKFWIYIGATEFVYSQSKDFFYLNLLRKLSNEVTKNGQPYCLKCNKNYDISNNKDLIKNIKAKLILFGIPLSSLAIQDKMPLKDIIDSVEGSRVVEKDRGFISTEIENYRDNIENIFIILDSTEKLTLQTLDTWKERAEKINLTTYAIIEFRDRKDTSPIIHLVNMRPRCSSCGAFFYYEDVMSYFSRNARIPYTYNMHIIDNLLEMSLDQIKKIFSNIIINEELSNLISLKISDLAPESLFLRKLKTLIEYNITDTNIVIDHLSSLISEENSAQYQQLLDLIRLQGNSIYSFDSNIQMHSDHKTLKNKITGITFIKENLNYKQFKDTYKNHYTIGADSFLNKRNLELGYLLGFTQLTSPLFLKKSDSITTKDLISEHRCKMCRGSGVEFLIEDLLPQIPPPKIICRYCFGRKIDFMLTTATYKNINWVEFLALKFSDCRELFSDNKKISLLLNSILDLELGEETIGNHIWTGDRSILLKIEFAELLYKLRSDLAIENVAAWYPEVGLDIKEVDKFQDIITEIINKTQFITRSSFEKMYRYGKY